MMVSKTTRIEKYIFPLFFSLALSFSLFSNGLKAEEFSAKDIKDPKTICPECYVSNGDGILSDDCVRRVNERIESLNRKTGVQIAVVAVKGNETTSARELSMELFDLWKVGQAGKDNGIIILLTSESREIFIRTGYGIEGIVTDAVATRTVNSVMAPRFRQGKWDEGMYAGVNAVCDIVEKQYVGEESGFEKGVDYMPYVYVYLAACLFMLCFAVFDINRKHKHIDNNFKLEKIKAVRQAAYSWTIVGVLFLPMLPFLLEWIYGILIPRIRKSKVKCSCSANMRLLSEKEEDAYLSKKAQIEEEVGSRNYDVWLCDNCGNIVVYPYDKTFTQYEECPNCHAKTYGKTGERIILNATATRNGILRKTYFCQHCGHSAYKDSTIPRNDTVFLAAGGMRGHSGGGFSSGGGWGGGFSGGGGGGGSF